ncbi:MAG: HDOD domain-containing protein [Planctomycetota bacterium]
MTSPEDKQPRDELVERGATALTLPHAIAEIVRLSASETSSCAEVARLCEADLALTGRLMACVNSRLLGARQPTRSVLQATVWLGARRVRNLAIASHLTDLFAGIDAFYPIRGFWHHSFAVAEIARELADDPVLPPEDVYLAGLLHDIGQPLFSGLEPTKYRTVMEVASRRVPVEAEVKQFGRNHAEFGARCIQNWGLPEVLCEAIASHHDGRPDAPSVPESGLATILRQADRIAWDYGRGLRSGEGGSFRGTKVSAKRVPISSCLRDAQQVERLFSILPGPTQAFPGDGPLVVARS